MSSEFGRRKIEFTARKTRKSLKERTIMVRNLSDMVEIVEKTHEVAKYIWWIKTHKDKRKGAIIMVELIYSTHQKNSYQYSLYKRNPKSRNSGSTRGRQQKTLVEPLIF